jgi:hypothetical protein
MESVIKKGFNLFVKISVNLWLIVFFERSFKMDLRAILKALVVKAVTPPQLKDNGDLAGNTYIDTLGLSGLLFLIVTGTIDAALGSTAEGTAPLIEECDTTGGGYTAVTSAALADAIGAGEDDSVFGIFVNLAKTHKRYMRVQAPHAGDGTNGVNACILAIGFPSDQMPKNAAEMGLAELIEA